MRKTQLIILFVCIFFSQSIAQNKTQRRIYLWDVTLSTKGYGGTPNIYKDVVSFLENDINSLTDENTEIIVLPFQQETLERWEVKATLQGKKDIIQRIKEYNNENLSLTNIYAPLLDVKDNYIKNDKRTLLFLLTDGKHNDIKHHSKNDLLNLLGSLCQYLKFEDAYAFYIMLTENAIDEDIINIINDCDRIDIPPSGVPVDIIELQPSELVKFNIKDDNEKPVVITLTCKKDLALPEGIKVSVNRYNDTIFKIDETVELKNLALSFDLNYNYQDLKNSLPERTKIPLKLELLNQQEIKDKTGKIILLNPAEIELELINKPEKTLRIHVKK